MAAAPPDVVAAEGEMTGYRQPVTPPLHSGRPLASLQAE